MDRIRGLNLAQKVVIVIALALGFLIVGLYVANNGYTGLPGASLAPATQSTDTYFVVRHYSALRVLVVPLILVGVWATVSVWLLGAGRRPSSTGGPDRHDG